MQPRMTWLAMASTAAGLLATAAPGAAHAASTAAMSTAAAFPVPICGSWTDFNVVESGQTYTARLPSQARNNNLNCTFQVGTRSDGVYKLQDALNQCYRAGVPRDGVIGNEDVGAIITVHLQHRLPWDGNLYTPQLRNTMFWPLYRPDGSFGHCRSIRP